MKKIIFLFLFLIAAQLVSAEYSINKNHECISDNVKVNQSFCEGLCFNDLDCEGNTLCKNGTCIPSCREFFINWQHECKQKYDCQSPVPFCSGCSIRETDKSNCNNLCYDNTDCQNGGFCTEKKFCEKINYKKIILDFLNKVKWFSVQLIIWIILIFSSIKFLKSKKEAILKLGIKKITLIYCLLTLLFYLVIPYVPKPVYSVYNHFYLLPLYISIPLTIIALLSCVYRINKKITGIKIKIKHKHIFYTIISALSFFIFWFLRTKTFFGDANAIVWSLEHGQRFVNMGEPLTHYVYYLIFQITKNFSWNGFITIAFTSCFFGAIFIFFLFLLSDELKNKMVFWLILSLGTMQLFFGHVENYTILATGILVYIYVSLLYLRNKISITLPSIILTFTFLAHTSAGFLFPSLFYLYYKKNRANILKPDFLKMTLAIIIPVLILALSAYGFFGAPVDEYIKERPLGAIQGGSDQHTIVALFQTRTENEFFTMLSLKHVLEFIGENLHIAPVTFFLAFLLLFYSKKRIFKDPFLVFLVIMTAFYLTFTFIWNQDLGPYLDWDICSSAAIPYTMMVAYILPKLIIKNKELAYVSSIIVITNLMHTLPWIIYNYLNVL